MDNQNVLTYFDTPEKSTGDEIHVRTAKFYNNSPVVQIIEGIPGPVIVLDQNRQIIAVNQNAKTFFGIHNGAEIYGRRVGEALNCIHASEAPAGCGTTEYCRECGAAKSIRLTRQTKMNGFYECRAAVIKDGSEHSIDFNVSTSRLNMEGEEFILFFIKEHIQHQNSG